MTVLSQQGAAELRDIANRLVAAHKEGFGASNAVYMANVHITEFIEKYKEQSRAPSAIKQVNEVLENHSARIEEMEDRLNFITTQAANLASLGKLTKEK